MGSAIDTYQQTKLQLTAWWALAIRAKEVNIGGRYTF